MDFYALMTLDLHEKVTSKQRGLFDSALKAAKWKKLDETSTTYYARYKNNVSVKMAYEMAEIDLEVAAIAAENVSVNAVVIVSKEKGYSISIGPEAK